MFDEFGNFIPVTAKEMRRGRFNRIERMINLGQVNCEGDGGGGNTEPTVEELKAQLETLKASEAAAKKSAESLEAKRTELLNESKTLKEQMKQFEGLPEAEKIKAMYKAFENDEDMKLIAEGKHDEVIKKRTEKVQAEFQSKLEALQTENETLKGSASKSEERIRDLIIDSDIVSEFISAKGRESAVDDIKLRARQIWKVEDGEAIPRDAKGEIMRGKDGVLTKKEYIEGLRETAPHLFPDSTGGDSGGNRGGNATGIDAKIIAARKAGNASEVRRLKAVKAKQGE